MADLPFVIVPSDLLIECARILENSMFEFIATGERAQVIAAQLRKCPSIASPQEPVVKAVERILDEHSAWIARPSDEVTKAVALAATCAAWVEIESARPPVSLEEIVEVLRKIDDIDPMELNLNNYNDDDVAQLSANASYVAVQIRSILSRLETAE